MRLGSFGATTPMRPRNVARPHKAGFGPPQQNLNTPRRPDMGLKALARMIPGMKGMTAKGLYPSKKV